MGVPVTLIYAGLHGLLLVALSIQVLRYRVRADVKGPEVAQRMERVQANFAEYVPMALLLQALNELAGSPPAALHLLGCLLFLSRLVHAYGLGYLGSRNYPRTLGALGTFVVIATLSFGALLQGYARLRAGY